MPLRYTYLLVNLGAILIPLCYSFDPRVNFYKKWRYFIPAAAVVAIFFVAWDNWFTKQGIWGFNPAYIIGIKLGQLPLEEVLFFFCIPYACVFLYEVIRYFKSRTGRVWPVVVSRLLLVLAVVLLVAYRDRMYTAMMAAGLALALVAVLFILKPDYMGYFYVMFLISKVPFMIVNGILTNGLRQYGHGPVVWYQEAGIIGPRVLGMPVEDMGYSMLLLLLNVVVFEFLRGRSTIREGFRNG